MSATSMRARCTSRTCAAKSSATRRTRSVSSPCAGWATSSSPRRSYGLCAEDCTPRAREEAGFDQQRHDDRLADRLAVEALDGEAPCSAPLNVGDERRQGDAEPLFFRLPKRDERSAAALDEECGLAAEQHDLGARDPCRSRACAL